MSLCKTELAPTTFTSNGEPQPFQSYWSTDNYVQLEIKCSVLQQLFSGHHLVATDICCQSSKDNSTIRQMLLNCLLCKHCTETGI